MTKKEVVIVLDCGSTNLRAIAVDSEGRLLSQSSRPNKTVGESRDPRLRIWDLDDVWKKLCSATREVVSDIQDADVAGIIVATWGADGAPVRKNGSLAYPVISWQCTRTQELAVGAPELMDPWRIFEISGYQIMSINTLFKLIWLRRNAPEALDRSDHWLMMPGLIGARLGAEPHVDPTSASTTMAMDLSRRDWSPELLALAGLGTDFFPEWHYPGDVVGEVSSDASERSGLPAGTPILAGGHDTQFALLGSGAAVDEAILSSGTWEILALRVPSFRPTREGFRGGLIFEADATKGLWNPQMLMMGSGVLEWVRDCFFSDVAGGDYRTLIELGRNIPAGSRGVTVVPSFVSDSGPTRRFCTKGTVLGLQLQTGRGEIYRAALEGLCFQLRQAMDVLSASTGMRPKGIRLVGGGSKNDLWSQIRADVTNLPVTITSQKEATVLGAAMIAFTGIGRFDIVESGIRAVDMDTKTFSPGEDSGTYEDLFEEYNQLPPGLEAFYGQG